MAASVPTVAAWRLSAVPKYLTPKEVRRVLKACTRRTPAGRRDYAILLLLACLGLRAGEVVALAWRLDMVRRFAIWLSATDLQTEIPPVGILSHRYRRKTPHIYTDTEIKKILGQAQQLPSSKGLRASTFTTLFGLLAVTGMRVNEALGLDRQDVDLTLGILHIRRTKFGKSRYVPVHPSTVEALKKYTEARDRIVSALPTPAFFISERGGRITEWTARYTFAKLSQHLGLRISAKGHGR